MKRALNLLRETASIRRQCFSEGLVAAGFNVVEALPDPREGDVLLTWNRSTGRDVQARQFEQSGARVLVAENGYLRLRGWYALAEGHHAGAGKWPVGGADRWDRLGVELQPWREGTETVILGQRSIGEPGIASPQGWEESIRRKVGGRIRPHPGKHDPRVPLEQDLKRARCVVTWASAAALQALVMGIPVFHGFPRWIGAGASRPVAEFEKGPLRGDRLEMFRRLAWAQWNVDEIRKGEAFCQLLGR